MAYPGVDEDFDFSDEVGLCAGSAPQPPRQCSDEINKMSAQQVCEAVQQKKKGIWDAVSDIANAAVGVVRPWVPMLDSLTANSEVEQNIRNQMGVNIDVQTIIDQTATCDQIISQIQENIVSGPSSECIDAWRRAGLSSDQILEASKVNVRDINQFNEAEATANCELNLAIEALSQLDATIDNLAMQDALSEASGLLAKSSVSQDICNAININQSACKYIQQNQCCAAVINQNQRNVVDTGCSSGSFRDINQRNVAATFASCQLSSASSVSDTITADITNKSGQTGESKATGLDLAALLGIIIGIIVLIASIGGLKVLFGGEKTKKGGPGTTAGGAEGGDETKWWIITPILIGLGCLVTIAGVVCIMLWGTSKTKAVGPRIDRPFVTCPDTALVETKFEDLPIGADGLSDEIDVDDLLEEVTQSSARGTFKQIKDKSLENSRIIGYDFFPDLPEEGTVDPSTISDDHLGLGVFLGSVSPEDKEEKNTCPPIENFNLNRSISMIHEGEDKNLLILAIVLMVLGILLLLLIFLRAVFT